jgi:fructokinase
VTALVAGEALVDLVADADSLAAAERFRRRPGGAPANVAVGLARLGGAPALRARVGDDPFGAFLTDHLAEAGVDVGPVETDPDAPTGLAFVAGESFAFRRDGSADTRLAPGRPPDERLAAADALHAGGLLLATEPARGATYDLLERAPPDTLVSFDPNARPSVWAASAHAYGPSVRRAVAAADVVAATPAELRAAGYEGDPVGLAAAVLADGPHTALLTRGAAGAVGATGPGAPCGRARASHGGYDVDAVDPTGAGDAFLAGAVTALREGRALADVLAFADAVAARSTTATGATAALPTRAEARALVER